MCDEKLSRSPKIKDFGNLKYWSLFICYLIFTSVGIGFTIYGCGEMLNKRDLDWYAFLKKAEERCAPLKFVDARTSLYTNGTILFCTDENGNVKEKYLESVK